MELFMIIATLCMVHPAAERSGNPATIRYVDAYQHTCQKYYVTCMRHKPGDVTTQMADCIMQREVK